jgi:hypothetical protein
MVEKRDEDPDCMPQYKGRGRRSQSGERRGQGTWVRDHGSKKAKTTLTIDSMNPYDHYGSIMYGK